MFWILNGCIFDSVEDFLSVLIKILFIYNWLEVKRQLTNKQFIGHNTQRPDIALVSIFLSFKNLRRHISRWPNDSWHHAIKFLIVLGKSKVSNFQLTVFNKYILWLNVPLNLKKIYLWIIPNLNISPNPLRSWMRYLIV